MWRPYLWRHFFAACLLSCKAFAHIACKENLCIMKNIILTYHVCLMFVAYRWQIRVSASAQILHCSPGNSGFEMSCFLRTLSGFPSLFGCTKLRFTCNASARNPRRHPFRHLNHLNILKNKVPSQRKYMNHEFRTKLMSATKKTILLSMKYWLANRDPCNGL